MFPSPGDRTQVSHIVGGFFHQLSHHRSPRIPGLSFLQRIFPTQESNPGLLHCRQIVYQLSYQGSPMAESEEKKSLFMRMKEESEHAGLKLNIRDFPGGPMVKTLCFQCQGMGSILVRELRSHMLHGTDTK